MQATTVERELTGLYESLARYQWIRRRLARARPGTGLEMHKSLAPPAADAQGPGAGLASLHDWLLEWLQPSDDGSVLDLGCGFGATLLHWATRRSGHQVGLSASPFQVRKANAEAKRLGLTDRCEFRLQSYDDPIAGRHCAAVAVEALFHAEDLGHTSSNLAQCMEPGGRLVLLEDMAVDDAAAGHDDGIALLRQWSTPHLHTLADFRSALARAGFEPIAERDLTPQVRHRGLAELDTAQRRLHRLRRLSPLRSGRRLCDAFLGGIALERLYARSMMRYVAILSARHGGGDDER